jgi:hypothetical protein
MGKIMVITGAVVLRGREQAEPDGTRKWWQGNYFELWPCSDEN